MFMARNNQFETTEPMVHVSATISTIFWKALRELQVRGYKSSGWSDVMRLGSKLVIESSKDNDPYKNEARLMQKLELVSRELAELKRQRDPNLPQIVSASDEVTE